MNRGVPVEFPGGDGVQSLPQPARQTVTLDSSVLKRICPVLSEAVGILKHS
jgi:hypothetical protein